MRYDSTARHCLLTSTMGGATSPRLGPFPSSRSRLSFPLRHADATLMDRFKLALISLALTVTLGMALILGLVLVRIHHYPR